MKKLLIGIGILILCLAGNSVAFGQINLEFKTKKYPRQWDFYGKPLNVEKVIYTGKKFINQETGKYNYVYKILVRRPSKDNGEGIVKNNVLDHRIFYWAAHDGWNLRIALLNNMSVYQDITPDNPRYITINIQLGLAPQRHRIRIAAIPYPMIGGTYRFRDVMQLYRNSYLNWAKDLLTATTPQGIVGSIAWGVATDAALDSFIAAVSTEFGQIIEFDVPVIMPKITTRYENDAKKLLEQHDLYPSPSYQIFDKTTDQRLHERISRQQYEVNSLVKPGSYIAYKFWKWDGNKHPQPVKYPDINPDPEPIIYNPDPVNTSSECPDINPDPGNSDEQIFPKPLKYPGSYVKCRYHWGGSILGSKIVYRDNKKVVAEYFDSRNFRSKLIQYDEKGKKSKVTNFYDNDKRSSISTYDSSGEKLTYKAWYRDGREKF